MKSRTKVQAATKHLLKKQRAGRPYSHPGQRKLKEVISRQGEFQGKHLSQQEGSLCCHKEVTPHIGHKEPTYGGLLRASEYGTKT